MKKRLAAFAATLAIASLPAMASALTLSGNTMTSEGYVFYDSYAESVKLTDTDGTKDTSLAYLLFEFAGNANGNTLGIYSFSQTGDVVTLGNKLEVFSGPQSPGAIVKLAFDLAAGTVTNLKTGASQTGFGSTFGFYMYSSDQNATFYTHNQLNETSNGEKVDHFRIFDTSSYLPDELKGSDVVLAIEDLLNGGDRDYDDMIVGVTDVVPTPEPGTIALLGAGLIAAPFIRRKMKK